MQGFPGNAGLACIVGSKLGGLWDINDEMAHFPIYLDPKSRSLTLYLRGFVQDRFWKGDPDPAQLSLSADDSIIRVDSVDTALCAALEKGIPASDFDPPQRPGQD